MNHQEAARKERRDRRREYAKAALQGLLAEGDGFPVTLQEHETRDEACYRSCLKGARQAWLIADAMLETEGEDV